MPMVGDTIVNGKLLGGNISNCCISGENVDTDKRGWIQGDKKGTDFNIVLYAMLRILIIWNF